jgi:coenzyme F420-reducing hydrogenase beta subunit
MKPDVLGFTYPEVDMSACVDCGLCEKVCAFVQDCDASLPVDRSLTAEVQAARHKDGNVVAASQSGGVFTALSDAVLSEGGVIYGAAYKGLDEVSHIRAESAQERNLLRGSKYVQSDMGQIFRSVREDLVNGRKVLFSGTPCQVAGLKSYIPEQLSEKLVLVDFVCHGVPSPLVWKDYVKHMARKGNLVKAIFRDKSVAGWKVHADSFLYEDGKKRTGDTFRVLFYKNIILRHNCGNCPYNVTAHPADVTIGDFWGVAEVLPVMDPGAGTSMVICNTEKGKILLSSAACELELETVSLTYDFMSRKNPNLVRPANIYKDRRRFEEEYSRKGFLHVARRWGDLGWSYKAWQLKTWLKRLVGRGK